MLPPFSLDQSIEKTVREEWGRILASLVKSLGDIQLAEDCLQDAIVSAMTHWQRNGLPNSPAAWLITVARRKAIDRLRKSQKFAAKQDEILYLQSLENQPTDDLTGDDIPDKRLEMIFTCCHPSLEEKTQVALTLRNLGGLSTEEIASAYLDSADTMQRRLARAKKKIAAVKIPYRVPDQEDLPERLSTVLRVLYLIFNEGYSASSGERLTRVELSDEAIRLARIVSKLMPDETEVFGLLALMLLHDARRTARSNVDGSMIALEHQNRARWDKAKIAEGVSILTDTLPKQRIGPYQLQAAISAVHDQSSSWDEMDWREISALYDLLYEIQPSPVVLINRAMAVSYAHSIDDALTLLDQANRDGKLDTYQHYFAARADMFLRTDKFEEAASHLRTAIDLSKNDQEKAFLHSKLEQCQNSGHES